MTNIFKFNEQPLRHIELDGEPWFVATDVCTILGLAIRAGHTNAGHYLRSLRADEKQVLDRATGGIVSPLFACTRASRVSVISESSLYRLTLRADKATARPFQDWVTREVLPSIRRTGGCLLNEAARETVHADRVYVWRTCLSDTACVQIGLTL